MSDTPGGAEGELWAEVVVCIVLGSHQIWAITIQPTVFLTATRRHLQSLQPCSFIYEVLLPSWSTALCVRVCKLHNPLSGTHRRHCSSWRTICGMLILNLQTTHPGSGCGGPLSSLSRATSTSSDGGGAGSQAQASVERE